MHDCQILYSHRRSQRRSCHQSRQYTVSQNWARSNHQDMDWGGTRPLESLHPPHTCGTPPSCGLHRTRSHTVPSSHHYTRSESATDEAPQCRNWPRIRPRQRFHSANKHGGCSGCILARSRSDTCRPLRHCRSRSRALGQGRQCNCLPHSAGRYVPFTHATVLRPRGGTTRTTAATRAEQGALFLY